MIADDLPEVPCECGHVGKLELVVVRLGPECDEYRYQCAACHDVVVSTILGDDETVERIKRERQGWGVEVALGGQGAPIVEGPFPMGGASS